MDPLAEQAGDRKRMLAEHGVAGVAEPGQASRVVAEYVARSRGELESVRRDLARAARLDKEITGLREEQQVANELGRLLRATSFERWLCSEALDSLVAEASATLMELLGDQYQLDRTDRNDLVVIDYEDAGAQRPVHTLSGGETFQASLALSRQVVRLSAGMRNLQSMFLDGYGTLIVSRVAATPDGFGDKIDYLSARAASVVLPAPGGPVRLIGPYVPSRDASATARNSPDSALK